MHTGLLKYINEHTSSVLSSEEVILIESVFKPKKIKKKQYFLQKGDVCKYYAFIVKGAMRQFSVDDKDTEHIIHLSVENWWVGDRESYTMLVPSVYNIEAWEETDLLTITKDDFYFIIEKIPAIALMIRMMDQRNFIANQRRLNSSISDTADKRYEEFERCHPEFVRRFPQHLIASFLGITKSSLSRIRRLSLKKTA
jgi:CRP-like cAMP-binding protein